MMSIKLVGIVCMFICISGSFATNDSASSIEGKSSIKYLKGEFDHLDIEDQFELNNRSPSTERLNLPDESSCSCNSFDIGTPSEETYISDLISNGTIPSAGYINNNLNDCISINGTLVFDVDYTIIGGEIKMGPGSEIVIDRFVKVILSSINSNGGIHGCEKMWKGITVRPASSLYLVGCTIKDADYAVDIYGSPTIGIAFSNFINNYIGIHIPGVVSVSWRKIVNQPIPFIGNYFGCETNNCDLLEAYDGQTDIPISNRKAFAGVAAVDADIMIGTPSPTGFKNIFEDLQVGIISNNTFMKIYNNKFYNIKGTTMDYRRPYGKAIWIVRWGLLDIQDNYIDGAKFGIVSERVIDIRAKNNRIKNVDEGIYCISSSAGPKIIGNNISYKTRGITINSIKATPPEVRDNLLTATKKYNYRNPALSIIDVNPGFSRRIKNNTIVLYPESDGIKLLNTHGISLNSNTISYELQGGLTGWTGTGINLSGSSENHIISNTVIHSDVSHVLAYVNRISNTNTYCCNGADSTLVGYSFRGMCDDTEFKYNDINYHKSGLQLHPSTILGDQDNSGNTWNKPSVNKDAIHYGSFVERMSSEFIVNTCADPLWPSSIHPSQQCNSNQSNWFILDEGVISNCIDDDLCLDTIIGPAPIITENDIRLIEGAYDTSEYANMLIWEKSKQLYQKIINNFSLYGQNDSIDSFYNNADTTMVQLIEIENRIRNLTSDHDTTLISKIEDDSKYIDKLLDDIAEIDSLLSAANNSQDSTNLINQRLLKLDTLHIKSISIEESNDSLRQKAVTDAAVIMNENSIIPVNTVIHEYERDINDAYLKTFIKGVDSLSSTQLNTVYNIANSCSMEYGTVVYRARGIYELIDSVHFNDDTLCNSTEGIISSEKRNSAINDNKKIGIWPNPASNKINISIPSDLLINENTRLVIIDIKGVEVYNSSIDFDSKNHSINVSKLANGYYFIYLQSESYFSKASKFHIKQ